MGKLHRAAGGEARALSTPGANASSRLEHLTARTEVRAPGIEAAALEHDALTADAARRAGPSVHPEPRRRVPPLRRPPRPGVSRTVRPPLDSSTFIPSRRRAVRTSRSRTSSSSADTGVNGCTRSAKHTSLLKTLPIPASAR